MSNYDANEPLPADEPAPMPDASRAADPASETNEVAYSSGQVTPAVTPPSMPPPAQRSTSGSGGFGAKFIAIVASLALLFGVIGGGVAGGVAGYVIADHNDAEQVATVVAPDAQAQQVATEPTPAEQESVSDLVAKVNPAVVTIENTLESQGGFFGQSGGGVATGSGFIIDEDGHIVTNNHVIDGAASLKVTFSDGTEADATLIGTDPYQDVAVIKVDVPVPATVSFGDSDALRAGDSVLAIGSALGEFTNSVTNGIVSATDRSLDTGEGYRLDNLIQHNAPISPGNSGGPLIDMDGHVIGMNTAVVRGSGQATAEGLGFAVAGNTVKQIAENIINSGTAQRPYIGISFSDAATVGSDSTGVVIQDVVRGGPADLAGLEAGDVITEVNGVAIDAENPFLNLMYQYIPGDVVELTIDHNGQSEVVSVTLGTRPESAG